ncbi:MAG: DUF4336 domain-containing protein [Myxococcota bacterium]
MAEPLLRRLGEGLWVVNRPLRIVGLHIGARMTVIRLANGELFLHSPVEIDDELCEELSALGGVGHIVAPNKVHHLFFGQAAAIYPDAARYAAPGLPEKRRDLDFHEVLGNEAPPAWSGEIEQRVIGGMPMVGEVVFLHRASGTLLLTDLAFNMRETDSFLTRQWMRLMGIHGKFGPTRMFKQFIRDREAARASLDEILSWDFDRVIVTHGVVLQERGRRALRDAYRWMG